MPVSYGGQGAIAVASGDGPVTVGLPSGTVEGDVVHLSASPAVAVASAAQSPVPTLARPMRSRGTT